MHACRTSICLAIAAAFAVAGGWLCAQDSPFAGAAALDAPGVQRVSPTPSRPFAGAETLATVETNPPASRPSWVDAPLDPTGRAKVERLVPGKAGTPGTVDVVVLDGGTNQGLRDGVKCLVERGNQTIAEIIIVATTPERSAGLILGLGINATIQAGDVTRLKKLEL